MLMLVGLCGRVQAKPDGVTINVNQVGSDIVWDWGGSLTTTGTTQVDYFGGFSAYVKPDYVNVLLYASAGNNKAYTITGPSFYDLGEGSGYNGFTTTSGNTSFAVTQYGTQVYLSESYVSGSSIYGTNTMANKTLAGIGLNGGKYEWTVAGSGNKITMNVNVIPEPASLMMLGFGGLVVVGYRRFFGRI